MAIKGLFKNKQHTRNDSENVWFNPPEIPQISGGKLQELSPFNLIQDLPKYDPERYPPSIVIGLGATGDFVVRQWLKLLEQDTAGPQNKLRVITICSNDTTPLPDQYLKVPPRQISLANSIIELNVSNHAFSSRREEIRSSFCSFGSKTTFIEQLTACKSQLVSNDIQIVIVVNMLEEESGILGDILKEIRRVDGSPKVFNRVNGLVTIHPCKKSSVLDNEEIYAALRELGRFTFNGLHSLAIDEPDNRYDPKYQQSLLDHIFFFDNQSSYPDGPDLSYVSFEDGIGQAMVEMLFTMIHPATHQIFLGIQNDLAGAATLRNKLHETIIHGVGIATIDIPYIEMREYLSVRLARAVLFGEKYNLLDEGILYCNEVSSNVDGRSLAIHWLSNKVAPHPFFHWLVDTEFQPKIKEFPSCGEQNREKLLLAFRTKIIQGAMDVLNDIEATNRLIAVIAGLNWLNTYFASLVKKLAIISVSQWAERETFIGLINDFSIIMQSALESLSGWQDVLKMQDLKPQKTELLLSPNDNKSFYSIIEDRQIASEEKLIASTHGLIRRAIPSPNNGEIAQAEAYYESTIRRGLNSPINTGNDKNFSNVRERIGWWFTFPAKDKIEFLLVCLGPEMEGGGELFPPPSACFSKLQLREFWDSVVLLSDREINQIDNLAHALARAWFDELIAGGSEFLKQAAYPLIDYDLKSESSSLSRRAFLVSENRNLSKKYIDRVFPDYSAEVRDIEALELHRVTALTLWMNIPSGTLKNLSEIRGCYKHRWQSQLYLGERNAAILEARVATLLGKSSELPPDFIYTLIDKRYVTLFCQAYFCGLITLKTYNEQFQEVIRWIIKEVKAGNEVWKQQIVHEEKSLSHIIPDFLESLLAAYNNFTSQLPNNKELIGAYNPLSPMYRDDYFNAIHRISWEIRKDSKFEQARVKQLKKQFKSWRGKYFSLQHIAFIDLLEVELEEPLWEGWGHFR